MQTVQQRSSDEIVISLIRNEGSQASGNMIFKEIEKD